MRAAILTAKHSTAILRIGHNYRFAAFTTAKFPIYRKRANPFGMFPIGFFTALRTKLQPAVFRFGDIYYFPAFQTAKFPYNRFPYRNGKLCMVIAAMPVSIPPAGSAAILLR